MPVDPNTMEQRISAARKHLSAIYGTPGQESDLTLFVSHHLDDIDAAYWVKHTGTAAPEPQQVLALLVPDSMWQDDEEEDEDEREFLDFTLPDGVTNYMVCVTFDDAGQIVGVAMES